MSRPNITRRYWKTYPKEQGIASFCVAIACVLFISLVNLFLSETFFNQTYILLISAFLFWGISCLVVGWIMDRKKNNNRITIKNR